MKIPVVDLGSHPLNMIIATVAIMNRSEFDRTFIFFLVVAIVDFMAKILIFDFNEGVVKAKRLYYICIVVYQVYN